MSTGGEHPIERAERLIDGQPILALDWALRAFGDTRGHRSDPDTVHYLDVMGAAVLRASGITLDSDEPPLDRMFREPVCDALATAALLRLLVLDDDVFEWPCCESPRTASSGLRPSSPVRAISVS